MILSFVLVPLCFYFVHELKSSPLTMGGVNQRNMHTSCLFLTSSETLNGNSVHIIVSRGITNFIPNSAHLYIKLQTQNKKKILCAYTCTHSVCMYSQNPNISESEQLDIHYGRAYVYMNYIQPCNLFGFVLISLATLKQHQHTFANNREK